MGKLELKHLAPYLPYGICCYLMGEPTHNIIEIVGANIDYVEIHEIGRTITDEYPYCDITPKLRPLYQLTQEIEHNGEKFVPYQRLLNFAINYGVNKILIEKCLNAIVSDSGINNSSVVFDLPYYMVEKLFEWHIDVFGLIEKGLAIEKQ